MRFFFRACLCLIFGMACPGLQEASVAQEKEPQIADLLRRLGDSRFSTREAAGKELRLLGEKALPPLRSAAADGKLEIRVRAQHLIDAIIEAACKSKSTGLELVRVPAGEFQMGTLEKERGRQADELPHRARITKLFLLGKYEVTQDEFEKVTKAKPSYFVESVYKPKTLDTSRYPVDRVTWFDAIEFCNKLSERDGYTPYYRLAEVNRPESSIKAATVTVVGGSGYRLPTEAEWEYACRAKTTTPYSFGLQLNERQANAKFTAVIAYGTRTQSLGRTTDVGSYPANPWGLCDMHGNVGEWCWDWYQRDGYKDTPVEDPQGPREGVHRVLRGGSWLVNIANCRSASRFWQAPAEATYFAGFRVARTP